MRKSGQKVISRIKGLGRKMIDLASPRPLIAKQSTLLKVSLASCASYPIPFKTA